MDVFPEDLPADQVPAWDGDDDFDLDEMQPEDSPEVGPQTTLFRCRLRSLMLSRVLWARRKIEGRTTKAPRLYLKLTVLRLTSQRAAVDV